MTATIPDWLEPVRSVAGTVRARDLSPLIPPAPDDARPAAVLMVFADRASGPELLLTERAPTLRSHAGQISFPGGSRDQTDADDIEAALREADEEVGLHVDAVDVFATLPRIWLPPSNFAVRPVLSYLREPVELYIRSPDEVASVLWTPIEHLLDPANRFTVVHPMGWKGPGFDIGIETPLWGFTAGIVARLFQAAGWEKAWDESKVRPVPGTE